MPPITKPKPQANLFRIMIAGAVTGIGSSFICLFYKWVFTRYTGFTLEEFVNVYYIFLGCLAGSLMAAFGYFVLSNLMAKPNMLFVFLVFVLMILSLLAPLSPTLPDKTTAPEDFTLLTVPMHVFTGLIITYLIPAIAGPPKLIHRG